MIDESVRQGLALLPAKMATGMHEVFAIGFQESNFQYRRQLGNGPARGFWQFEKGGGVHGVMTHKAVKDIAKEVCEARGVEWDETAVWKALETDDVLAFCFARLLLWTDSRKVPTTEEMGWTVYFETWRPGKPHPEKWEQSWALGAQAVAKYGL